MFHSELCESFPFQTVEQSLGAATTLSTPEDQVQALIKQVAEENDLEINDQLLGLEPGQSTLASEGSKSVSRQKEDALERRYTHGSNQFMRSNNNCKLRM